MHSKAAKLFSFAVIALAVFHQSAVVLAATSDCEADAGTWWSRLPGYGVVP
jgi:hypothetical protein